MTAEEPGVMGLTQEQGVNCHFVCCSECLFRQKTVVRVFRIRKKENISLTILLIPKGQTKKIWSSSYRVKYKSERGVLSPHMPVILYL